MIIQFKVKLIDPLGLLTINFAQDTQLLSVLYMQCRVLRAYYCSKNPIYSAYRAL